ncbi:MAG: hypothetical protein V1809_08485 [Planctomycetota bacterium]
MPNQFRWIQMRLMVITPSQFPYGLILFAALVSGCVTAPFFRPSSWRNAPLDPKTGQVVMMWVKHAAGDEPALLRLDYGMLIVWGETERGFYLFDRSAKRYLGTTDFDQFLEELDRLPKDIRLQRVETCSSPRAWNMPEKASNRLNAIMENGGRTDTLTDLKGNELPDIFCYCESDGLRYPEIPPPPYRQVQPSR